MGIDLESEPRKFEASNLLSARQEASIVVIE
jgi:hypothetical protein